MDAKMVMEGGQMREGSDIEVLVAWWLDWDVTRGDGRRDIKSRLGERKFGMFSDQFITSITDKQTFVNPISISSFESHQTPNHQSSCVFTYPTQCRNSNITMATTTLPHPTEKATNTLRRTAAVSGKRHQRLGTTSYTALAAPTTRFDVDE